MITDKRELENGWFGEGGQEDPVEVWAFSVYHDHEKHEKTTICCAASAKHVARLEMPIWTQGAS